MRIIIIIIVGLVAFIGSCKPEPKTTLVLEFYNTSSANILVNKYIKGNSVLLMNLSSGQHWNSQSYSAMGRGVSSVFQYALTADSLVVVFNDSLRIVHLVQVEGSFSSSQFDDRADIFWLDNPRNLKNLNSYILDHINEESVRARYEFTESDLEHAISIYE